MTYESEMPINSGEDPPLPPHDGSPRQEARAPGPTADQLPANEDDGFTVVGSGNLRRKVKISHNMVQAPTPPFPAQLAAPDCPASSP